MGNRIAGIVWSDYLFPRPACAGGVHFSYVILVQWSKVMRELEPHLALTVLAIAGINSGNITGIVTGI